MEHKTLVILKIQANYDSVEFLVIACSRDPGGLFWTGPIRRQKRMFEDLHWSQFEARESDPRTNEGNNVTHH
ncbi:MAG: hypothetical protein ACKJSK_13705 [Roseibacillus sp.]